MRATLALLAALTVQACSSPAATNLAWYKPGATLQATRLAIAACEGRVNELQAINPQAPYAYLDAAMQGCMADRGFGTRTERP